MKIGKLIQAALLAAPLALPATALAQAGGATGADSATPEPGAEKVAPPLPDTNKSGSPEKMGNQNDPGDSSGSSSDDNKGHHNRAQHPSNGDPGAQPGGSGAQPGGSGAQPGGSGDIQR